MTDDNRPATGPLAPEPTIFSAILTPNRSLGAPGFLALMLALGASTFAAGVLFVSMGAWPVVLFLGLDVVLVYLAFRLSFRASTAYEEVVVTPTTLTVRKVDGRGRAYEVAFNPVWVRLSREAHEEFGVMRLALHESGRRVDIATFLGPAEKASFHDALASALSSARRGIPLAEA